MEKITKAYITHFILLLSLIGCKKEVKELSFYPCDEKTFWQSVCMAESKCNPRAKYYELNGTLSAGLYMLSVSDAAIYGCDFKVESDLFDAKKNEDCKNKIAAKLRARYPAETWDQSLARYWGTMRSKEKWPEYHRKFKEATGREHTGYKNLQYYAKQKGCIIY